MKKASKIRYMLWYAAFVSFLQYKREKKWGVYIFVNTLTSFIWIFAGLYFSNLILESSFRPVSFFTFVAGVKCFGAMLEKYAESGIGYNLSKDMPLTNFDVLFIRVVSSNLQLSEWLYKGIAAYVVYRNTEDLASFMIYYILSMVLIALIKEIFALISFNIHTKSVLSAFMWLLMGACFYVTFVPFYVDTLVNPQIVGMMIVLAASMLFLFIFNSKLTFLSVFRTTRLRDRRESIVSRIMAHKKTKLSALNLLILKELIFVLRYKISLFLSAISYAILALFLTKDIQYLAAANTLFIIDFAAFYGFNYLGIEEETLGLSILSPVDRKTIIRAKNIVFLVISAIGTLFMTIITMIKHPSSVVLGWDFVSCFIFTVSIMTFFCAYVSIRNYTNSNEKKKYTMGKLFYIIVSFIFVSLVYSFVQETPSIKGMFLSFVGVLFFVIIYTCIINPAIFSKMLIEKERKILNSLSK